MKMLGPWRPSILPNGVLASSSRRTLVAVVKPPQPCRQLFLLEPLRRLAVFDVSLKLEFFYSFRACTSTSQIVSWES